MPKVYLNPAEYAKDQRKNASKKDQRQAANGKGNGGAAQRGAGSKATKQATGKAPKQATGKAAGKGPGRQASKAATRQAEKSASKRTVLQAAPGTGGAQRNKQTKKQAVTAVPSMNPHRQVYRNTGGSAAARPAPYVPKAASRQIMEQAAHHVPVQPPMHTSLVGSVNMVAQVATAKAILNSSSHPKKSEVRELLVVYEKGWIDDSRFSQLLQTIIFEA